MSQNLLAGGLKRTIFHSFLASLALVGTFTLTSCSSDDIAIDNPEKAYQVAQDYEKEERYEEALRRYNEIKNKFPYSKYATQSELSVADVYYKQESYPEAQVAYQNFKELHPKHPQVDYVTFRLAMSYFQQLPGTIDRDLTLAQSAILAFDEMIAQFPNSTYLQEAKDKRSESKKKLAEKEEYIADFYFKKEIYDSALSRYENLYRNHQGLGFDAKALSRAAICAKKTGDLDRAKKYSAILKQKFPGSSELESTLKEIK